MSSISVVIPAWNDAEFLAVCLDALRRQSRAADEIIVVDNASSDTTASIAAANGARVVYEPRRGIPAATAAGFDAATGEILARLDADSIPPADWLERVHDHLSGAPERSLVTGRGEFYGAGPVVCWLGTNVYIRGYFWSMTLLLGHPPVFGSNFAMHASAWRAVRSRVHRSVRNVHDDLDLSFQLEPDMSITYDPTLRVGISARPFDTLGGLGKRIWWAWLTIRVNARDESLLRRRGRWR